MGVETGFFRGENGLVLEMDLPLPDAFAGRLQRGEITRVNPDGSPWDGDAQSQPASAGDAGPAEAAKATKGRPRPAKPPKSTT
jgi:hypothetical protein